MRAVVQRVNHAILTVEDREISRIGTGYLVLVGFTDTDNEELVDRIVDRIVKMRIFRDDNGKTNNDLASDRKSVV